MFSVLTQSLRVKQATEYRRILLALPHEHLTGSIKVIRDPQRNAHQDDVCGVSDTGFDHHRDQYSTTETSSNHKTIDDPAYSQDNQKLLTRFVIHHTHYALNEPSLRNSCAFS